MPKTLSDIIPPSRRRAMESDMQGEQESIEPPRPRGSRGKFPYLYIAGALIVVAVCIGLLFALGGTTIKITPTVNETSVSGEWSATPSAGDLPFEVVSVDSIATEEVPAEGTEEANVPAQGTVTIYNAQEKKQDLIKNTRFESPDGKIFRIHESISVPAGSASSPGSLTVTVYADANGDSYNIGPSTFTLPGLKGGPLYELVYAKSDAPMTGGFSGTRPSVSESARQAKYEQMKPSLEKQLEASIAERVTDGYVLVPGSVTTTFTPQPDAPGTSSSVKVEYKGTATAYIFPNEALARALAYRLVAKYNGQPVLLESVDGLTLTPAGEEEPTPGMQSFNFTLSGNATIIWQVDQDAITEAVAGKTRDAARTILKGFPEIAEATLVLRPFWSNTLPENPTDIEVKVEGAKQSK